MMSHWQGLVANSLWILGLAAILAALSWRVYAKGQHSPQENLAQDAGFLCVLTVSFLSITLGLGLRPAQSGWKVIIWFLISLALAYQAWLSCHHETDSASYDDHE